MPEFRMPSLGADMDAGTLLEWLVKPGDPVHRGDVIAVVDTDKAAIEVECFDDGVIEQLIVEPGQKVPVGTVLASIAGAAAPPAAPAVVPAVAPPVEPGARVISPLVRHLAEDRGVDLGAVPATGGVVHRADIDHAAPAATVPTRPAPHPPPPPQRPVARSTGVRASPMARRLAAAAGLDLSAVSGTGTNGAIGADDVRRALSTGKQAAPPAVERAAVPDRGEAMRQAIAALMTRSNREIPHYYLTATIDMSAATAWLRARNRELDVSERLVPAALLLAATARAARDVSQLNGSWVDGAFVASPAVDLGLIVSLRRGGIMVPVIRDAADLAVAQVMATMRDLVERARTGRLRASELAPPSITVSNLGEQGVESVLGVIYPPQVALVGFGAVVERPWAVDGLLGVRPVITASLAADQRPATARSAPVPQPHGPALQKPEEL